MRSIVVPPLLGICIKKMDFLKLGLIEVEKLGTNFKSIFIINFLNFIIFY